MKKYKIISISFLLISFFVFSLTTENNKNVELPKYSPTDLSYDVRILKVALEKIHPGLFSYMNKEQFEKAYEQLSDSLKNPLTEWEFHKHVLDFIAELCCGHTQVLLSEKTVDYLNTLRLLPFNIKIIDSSVIVNKNYTKLHDMEPGTQILSINSTPIKEIVQKISRYSWADGFYQAPDLAEADFAFKYALIFGTPDNFRVQLKLQNGDTASHDIAAMLDKEMNEIEKEKYPDKFIPWTFGFDSVSNTAILGNIVFEGKGYKRFLEKSFATIEKRKVKNLVIDLRDNGGGEDEYPLWLFQYIALKPFNYYERIEAREVDPDDTIFKYLSDTRYYLNAIKSGHFNNTGTGYCTLKRSKHYNLREEMFNPRPDAFKGNVYLIVNSGSFSASTEFAAVAHYNKRCAVIGQETMGAYCGNNSGEELLLTLPKTGTRVYIPTYRYLSSCKNCPYGRGVIPDHIVFAEKSDFKGTDKVLRYTLDLIKKSTK